MSLYDEIKRLKRYIEILRADIHYVRNDYTVNVIQKEINKAQLILENAEKELLK